MLVYRTAVKYGLMKGDHKSRPYNESRSYCDYCGKQLKWYENVPVISWLILKGKTKCCHKKLPVSYPIVEMLMGVLFLLSVFLGRPQESPLQFWLGLLVIVLLVFSAVFDWKYMILPDFSTFILMFGGHIGPPLQLILSALAAAGFLLILNLITKGKGMGMGDVKLALFMGLFLGYPKIIIAFYVAFVVGAIYGLILIVFKKAKKKSQVPFGPFLILGTFVVWCFGNYLLSFIYKCF